MAWFRHGVQDVFPRADALKDRFRRERLYVVEKPFTSASVLKAVRTALDGEKPPG